MLYIPDAEITAKGGLDVVLDEPTRISWTKQLLASDYLADVSDKPINVAGSLSFVEQNPWI